MGDAADALVEDGIRNMAEGRDPTGPEDFGCYTCRHWNYAKDVCTMPMGKCYWQSAEPAEESETDERTAR